MAESGKDRPIAPPRSLGGPILPPPPPETPEDRRKAEQLAERRERSARAQEERERRQAERDAARARKEQEKAQKEAEKTAEKQAEKPAEKPAKRAKPAQESTGQSTRESTEKSEKAARSEEPVDRSAETTTVAAADRSATESQGSSGASGSTDSSKGRSRGSGTKAAAGKSGPRRTRRAQLRLVQIDAWSVMKTSFLLSIALGIVLVVAVAIIWSVLGAAGVWDSINSIVRQTVGTEDGNAFDIQEYAGTSRVLGFTMLVAVFDVILITAIATLGAFLYNLSAALLGGIEVTLAEDR